MEPSGYADIVFFAIVAGIILLKLRSVLGRKIGNEDMLTRLDRMLSPEKKGERGGEASPAARMAAALNAPETKKPVAPNAPEPDVADRALAVKIAPIRTADAHFHAGQFLDGAKMAFEMVLEAFSNADRDTLRRLLSDDVYRAFTAELDRLATAQRRDETTLVAIRSAEITDAGLSGKTARVTVTFKSEQIRVTRNVEGKIVEGDPSLVDRITDVWTFERDTSSGDPNWKVTAT